jgi:2-amino-4-hydroxy-6-hydroxymethyldihydropteridine diphosphokinase
MPSWQPAYIGVGSNLSEPHLQVTRAVQRLRSIPATHVGLVSRWYQSKPLGPQDQPEFVNGVAGVLTQLTPEELLGRLQDVEREFGRPAQHQHWGPRVIDLDLLVFGSERRATQALTLPHPGIVQRNFVLYPLADIAPDLDVPGLGRVAGLKSRLAATGLRVL